MRGNLARRLGLIALALALVGGCASPASPTPAAGAPATAVTSAAPAERVAAPAPASPTRVRHGLQPLAGSALTYIASDRGYFQQEGLDVELVTFASASELMPALATEQLDMGAVANNAALWNAIARGVSFKIVLDSQAVRPGRSATVLAMTKRVYDAGRGHRLDDLRGLTLAFTPPGKGTLNGCAVSTALQRLGLSIDDLEIQPLPYPEMVAALANNAVDGAMIAEPFFTRALRQGTIVPIMGIGEMYPTLNVSMIAFAPALYTNRAAAKSFVRAWLRATREFRAAFDGGPGEGDRALIEELIARHTGVDVASVREIAAPSYSPNALPNREALLHCYQFFRDQGQIPVPLSDTALAAVWGTELVEEVLDQVGRLPES